VRRDFQHTDIQHNGTQHNDSQHLDALSVIDLIEVLVRTFSF